MAREDDGFITADDYKDAFLACAAPTVAAQQCGLEAAEQIIHAAKHVYSDKDLARAVVTAYLTSATPPDVAGLCEKLDRIIEENETSLFRGEVETIRQAATALRLSAGGGWRTMDSAPKDGWDAPILVCQIGEAPDWYGNQLCAGYSAVPCSAYWNDAGDCWTYVERPHDVCEPTHWQPLPASPTAPAEGA